MTDITITLDTFIHKITKYLESLIIEESGKIQIFNNLNFPNITINDYLKRIYKYMKFDNADMYAVCSYISVLSNTCTINKNNIFVIFSVFSVLYDKMYNDNFHNNKYYSCVVGLNIIFLQEAEYELFIAIDMRLVIDNDMLNGVIKKIDKY